MSAKPTRLEIERELIWRRCEQSAWYFISNYVEVKDPRGAYQPWGLDWEHQADIAVWMQERWATPRKTTSGALKARQIGWTTIAHAFALWDILFHDNHEWLSVSVGEDEAKDAKTSKIKEPYLRLPRWMRKRGPDVDTDTAELYGFTNGSLIRAMPSTERTGRSRAVFGCLFDEAAFMQEANAVFAAVEPTVYGPMFVFSTANGMGDFFHEKWVDSLASDSEWDMKFYSWDVVPGRDQDWYDRTKRRYRTTPHLFYQEYPSNPTEAFLKSGRTAFDIELLEKEQDWQTPVLRIDLEGFEAKQVEDSSYQIGQDILEAGAESDVELHVWVEPYVMRDEAGRVVQEPNYAIGVDVAEGLAHGDNSALSVRDVNTDEQVATIQASIPIYDLGPIAEAVGYWYHTALIAVERNAFGLVPLEYLQRQGYPRIYRMDPIAEKRRKQKSPRYGWLTSRTTKPKMVQDMVKATVSLTQRVTLHDLRWFQEASTFVSTGSGRYEASAANTDDLMMAELIVHQAQLEIDRFPTIWVDDTESPLSFGDVLSVMAYADNTSTVSDQLNRPIGQPSREDPREESFMIPNRG